MPQDAKPKKRLCEMISKYCHTLANMNRRQGFHDEEFAAECDQMAHEMNRRANAAVKRGADGYSQE